MIITMLSDGPLAGQAVILKEILPEIRMVQAVPAGADLMPIHRYVTAGHLGVYTYKSSSYIRIPPTHPRNEPLYVVLDEAVSMDWDELIRYIEEHPEALKSFKGAASSNNGG